MARNNRKFGRDKNEFDQQLVDIARVTRIVAGGRRFRFRATIVMGNKKGMVGMGMGKGGDVSTAIGKAVAIAKKNMIKVSIVDNTIPHEVWVKYCGAKVFLKPAKAGTGVIAGGAVRTVMDLAGIRNITAKQYGSNNTPNNAMATLIALKGLRKPEEIAEARGKKVEDLVGKKREEKKVEVKEVKKVAEVKKPVKTVKK
ncbi:MAG: 30S ribosomal protein S5 [Patescibacteria group bacterium]|jgi:small subunit ribosomal protein S5